jgi:hypothetical protein
MGPSMLIATCLILAIRTAKWPARVHETASDTDLDSEIEYAHKLASRMFSTLITKHPVMFTHKRKPWFNRTTRTVRNEQIAIQSNQLLGVK